ncbi:hypothetical protein RF11_13289 [Thelohanellus kitauei]|uniref:SRCR domain-containing protein n=1 Tax=Thelohanellus kitauei TaxID=669202 RepID=A0A0C2N777_THEKT|nr:hypothetical protein RF11_13289 [Thelohanellus kitauei]
MFTITSFRVRILEASSSSHPIRIYKNENWCHESMNPENAIYCGFSDLVVSAQCADSLEYPCQYREVRSQDRKLKHGSRLTIFIILLVLLILSACCNIIIMRKYGSRHSTSEKI